ncbi:type II toxin-antitoxin system Phd/YefM family antitoxin [Rathayibacter soli]|uniref:type II toxin-antitoxin system Phd/YefM family antitoxin n=1 Tax=Rathayibacter soli TaxID=3144168 RepID=UPI0027E4AA5C|nr:type II toxin-antitoxin system prevent-host-death family antitoxin [Glaciibacter superstes]
MTLHGQKSSAEVGVRELHDQLSHYLRYVASGRDVVVTMRGHRVARLSPVDADDALADLRARGLVRDPEHERQPLRGRSRLTATGTVSDLVSEQRR